MNDAIVPDQTSPNPNGYPRQEVPGWLVPAAFVVGVLFLATVLALVTVNPAPTVAQFEVFKIVIALGGAAFATAFVGFIVVRIPFPGGGYVVAGGSLAVFLVLFFFSPASRLVAEPLPRISFRKNDKLFVATDTDGTLPLLLKAVAAAPLDAADQFPKRDLERHLNVFQIERPREVDEMIRSIVGDVLASDETKQHLRDWIDDERTIKVQVLRILAAFGARTLAGSAEFDAYKSGVGEALQGQAGFVVLDGEKGRMVVEAMRSRPDGPGQETDDAIISSALRYISVATTRLYAGLQVFPPKYFENVDGAFRTYMADVPFQHKEIVAAVAHADPPEGDALCELECGSELSYSRFRVLRSKISSTEAKRRLEHGPWPIGKPSDFFSERWWVDHAIWQMLSREHGRFLDGLPLRIEKFTAIGPP